LNLLNGMPFLLQFPCESAGLVMWAYPDAEAANNA
jgi:hypothetical protein